MKNRKSSQENRFYVYSHIRPSDGTCFYIGKGTGHRVLNGRSRNDEWYNVVYDEGGFLHKILINNISESDAYKYEKQFIEDIGLCNLTNIGSGKTDEWKKKIGESNKGNKRPDLAKRNMLKLNNPKTVPVIADGVEYPSRKLYAEFAGIHTSTVGDRIKSHSYDVRYK